MVPEHRPPTRDPQSAIFRPPCRGVGDQRDVEHAQPGGSRLASTKTPRCRDGRSAGRHHGAAAADLRFHDGAAHRIPHVHEGADRRRRRRRPSPARHAGAGSKIVADAAALLHGQGGFAEALEDADMSSAIVPITKQLNRVTLRPVPAPAITRPAGRNEAGQRRMEPLGPEFGVALGRCPAPGTRRQVPSKSPSSAAPAVAEAVFHVPDALGDGAHSIPES